MKSVRLLSQTEIHSTANKNKVSLQDFTAETFLISDTTSTKSNRLKQQDTSESDIVELHCCARSESSYMSNPPAKNKDKLQPRPTRSVSLADPYHLSHHQAIYKGTGDNNLYMGNSQTLDPPSRDARSIISETPRDNPDSSASLQDSESTGNCRLWSDNVYYKLFFDPRGREAKLMVLKCEITFVDIFTDEEHCLYRGRFIGAKTDGVANLFVFDLMKSHWEKKLPKSQAIELNVDIVMSSAPIHDCAESLLNLLRLEKSYLRHLHFDGQLNIMMRFAHPHGWDVKDDATRERVHNGLRNLFLEGVNLEVLSADAIVDEMRVDGIATENSEKIKHFTNKRHSWKAPNISPTSKTPNFSDDETMLADCDVRQNTMQRAESSSQHSGFEPLRGDAYQEHVHTAMWNIIQNNEQTSTSPTNDVVQI